MAARLAREHGGRERSWQRAMTEARTLHGHKDDHDQNVQRNHDVKQETGSTQTPP